MRKHTYFVRLERLNQPDKASFGISVRDAAGELNTFFACGQTGAALEIPAEFFRYLRDLEAACNAVIRWDHESFAAWSDKDRRENA